MDTALWCGRFCPGILAVQGQEIALWCAAMTHFGFLCPPFLGHLHPMQAVAAALGARGHNTTFFGLADMQPRLRAPGCRFVPLGRRSHPPGTLAALETRMGHPRGPRLFGIMRDMARMTDMLCDQAPTAFGREGVEVIVGDQLEPAAGLLAAHLGLPFVSIANALLINREPGMPPPFTGWRYDPSSAGLRRNAGGYRVADLMMFAPAGVVAAWARRWGLPARRHLDACLSPLLQISQTVPGFDFPREALPRFVHACGPLRSPEPSADVSDLLGDGRPLVYASLGTLQGGRLAVFQRIAAACEALDLHLVIAHGGRLSPEEVAHLPGRPVVRAFVPQRRLLAHAALALTNGGLNTVLDALAAGVPLVVVPIAFEQGAIAARLAYAGAGCAVPLRHASAARLRQAIATVLADPAYASGARRLSDEIGRAGGVERAASLIEAATAVTERQQARAS